MKIHLFVSNFGVCTRAWYGLETNILKKWFLKIRTKKKIYHMGTQINYIFKN